MATCGSYFALAELKIGPYISLQSSLSCRRLAGRDLGRCACARRPELVLALGELEALARAFLSVFLAFFHTGVAREKTVFA
jgi:hypothetical protein